jgi:hypothetical protein
VRFGKRAHYTTGPWQGQTLFYLLLLRPVRGVRRPARGIPQVISPVAASALSRDALRGRVLL